MGEPLLDTSLEEVIDFLRHEDDSRKRKVHGFWAMIFGVIGIAACFGTVPLSVIVTMRFMQSTGVIYLGVLAAVVMLTVGLFIAIGTFIAKRQFKPRYATWTSDLD